jgi:hypothetical protein
MEYFEFEDPRNPGYKFSIDEKSKSIESSAIFGENADILAFITGGIPALFMTSPGAVKSIRGSFEAGKVFEQALKKISYAGVEPSENITMTLTHFQHYIVPGMSPKLQAAMSFTAKKEGSEPNYSQYACVWDGKIAIGPGAEKDMLNEMIEFSLQHWSKNTCSEEGKTKFEKSEPLSGNFTGKGVKCAYNIFNSEGEIQQ